MSCILLMTGSCTTKFTLGLRTEPVDDPAVISGTYTLFVIGGTHGEDVKNIAVIDLEGDDLTFQAYASEYDYYKTENLEAQEALKEAVLAVSWHHSFWRKRISSILDDEGNVIGYEIRPLYKLLQFGFSDILQTTYSVKDDIVYIYLDYKPSLEDRIERDFRHHDD